MADLCKRRIRKGDRISIRSDIVEPVYVAVDEKGSDIALIDPVVGTKVSVLTAPTRLGIRLQSKGYLYLYNPDPGVWFDRLRITCPVENDVYLSRREGGLTESEEILVEVTSIPE